MTRVRRADGATRHGNGSGSDILALLCRAQRFNLWLGDKLPPYVGIPAAFDTAWVESRIVCVTLPA